MSLLSQKHLYDEQAAYDWVEAQVWPEGATCPKCGERDRVSKMGGKSTRIGAYKCYKCRKPFTVKVGTIFEDSKVKMHLWLQAFYLICGSKKGISANQLHRTLGVTLKTAWFMGHRIREALREGSLSVPPMGGAGAVIEADETYIGRKDDLPKGLKPRPGGSEKQAVLTLVERGGKARSFVIDRANAQNIEPVIAANIRRETAMMTDQASYYNALEANFESHDSVNHSKEEWARYEEGRPVIHSTTVESYFSVFTRGMKGTYQHCREKHLHRYLAEFDFRYNNRIALGVNDEERTVEAVKGVVGKRLTYRTTDPVGVS